MKLIITIGNEGFIAETNPMAPRTVDAVLNLIPFEQKVIHVRWSGEAIWVPLADYDLGVGFENHTSHPSIGHVLFYPGGYSETEILIAYGSCSFASKMGQLSGNHFLSIIDGHERLEKIGKEILWSGAKTITFELA